MSRREVLLGICEELVEKHKVGRGAVELGAVSVLVNVTNYISVVDWQRPWRKGCGPY